MAKTPSEIAQFIIKHLNFYRRLDEEEARHSDHPRVPPWEPEVEAEYQEAIEFVYDAAGRLALKNRATFWNDELDRAVGVDNYFRLQPLALEAQLCLIHERNTAWFTTQPLAEQRGEGWHQKPYNCNACRPHGYDHTRDQSAPWEIFAVQFDGNFLQPADLAFNVNLSVNDINAGLAPWLWSKDRKVVIWAGTNLLEFVRQVIAAGGVVYLPVQLEE